MRDEVRDYSSVPIRHDLKAQSASQRELCPAQLPSYVIDREHLASGFDRHPIMIHAGR